MNVPYSAWIVFNAVMLILILADLFLFNHKEKVTLKQALLTSAFWIALALGFNWVIYVYEGKELALKFLAGYLIEKSLSVDNLFVFILIFDYFHTPAQYQHKVLFWGILGAIVMRALFIFLGITLVHSFSWILYIFGLFLIYAGIKMALPKQEEINAENNFLLRIVRKFVSITPQYEEDRFFVKKMGKIWITPLFVVTLVVESTDLIFALDSIPAIMAITQDPFIIYTSNILAILGLRSLYFALSGLMPLFHFLHYGLSAILIFVGLKMLVEPWIHISVILSLSFIAISLVTSILASLFFPKQISH